MNFEGASQIQEPSCPMAQCGLGGFCKLEEDEDQKMDFNLVISVARDNWQMNNGAESYYNIIDSEKMEPALSF